jgi:hypothetical protein
MRAVVWIDSKRTGISSIRAERQPVRRVQSNARQGKEKGNARNLKFAAPFQDLFLSL